MTVNLPTYVSVDDSKPELVLVLKSAEVSKFSMKRIVEQNQLNGADVRYRPFDWRLTFLVLSGD